MHAQLCILILSQKTHLASLGKKWGREIGDRSKLFSQYCSLLGSGVQVEMWKYFQVHISSTEVSLNVHVSNCLYDFPTGMYHWLHVWLFSMYTFSSLSHRSKCDPYPPNYFSQKSRGLWSFFFCSIDPMSKTYIIPICSSLPLLPPANSKQLSVFWTIGSICVTPSLPLPLLSLNLWPT